MRKLLFAISAVFAGHIPVDGPPAINNPGKDVTIFTNSSGVDPINDMSGIPDATANFTIDNLNMDLNQCAVDIINKYGLHNDVQHVYDFVKDPLFAKVMESGTDAEARILIEEAAQIILENTPTDPHLLVQTMPPAVLSWVRQTYKVMQIDWKTAL